MHDLSPGRILKLTLQLFFHSLYNVSASAGVSFTRILFHCLISGGMWINS